MGVNGKFGNITRDDLLRVADRFAIGPAPRIIDKTVEAIADWPKFARQAGLNDIAIQSIAADFRPL
jgi:serine/threonine-protein kinase HipA